MDSLSIAVLAHIFPVRRGSGDPAFVWDQVRALHALHHMEVVAPVPWAPPGITPAHRREAARLPLREEWEGITVWRPRYPLLPRAALFSLVPAGYALTAGRRLARVCREADLIHAHHAIPDGVAAAWVGLRIGKPVVLTAHGSDLRGGCVVHRAWRAQISWAMPRMRAVIVSSDLMAQRALALGAREESVFIVPQMVDVTLFKPIAKAEARRRLGLSLDRQIVLFVGRLTPIKGLPGLLRSIALLAATQDVHLVIVGSGEQEATLHRLTCQLGLERRVLFAGAQSREKVAVWMGASDTVVLPSKSEGFGLALAEAIACGRPVVATRCGGPQAIVTPEVGELVPCDDVDGLSHALARVLQHIEAFRPSTLADYARAQWSSPTVAGRISEVYQRCLGNHDAK